MPVLLLLPLLCEKRVVDDVEDLEALSTSRLLFLNWRVAWRIYVIVKRVTLVFWQQDLESNRRRKLKKLYEWIKEIEINIGVHLKRTKNDITGWDQV